VGGTPEDLGPADLYHACGALTIAAALDARRRHPVGPSGRPSRVIYDVIDLAAESNAVTAMPPRVRARIARTDAAWARDADAIVAINEAFAARLRERDPGREITIVPNIPEPPDPSLIASPPDLIRAATGLPASTRIVLFHGRLGPDLGLENAADAILEVPDAALVLLGFGRGMADSRARDRDPRLAGRHLTLDARSPDEIVAWTASADVCLIPLPPVSASQRLTTPNKFWEAVSGGTPLVVVAGMTTLERLVREGDLGAVAASAAPADLAVAIRDVLARLDVEGRHGAGMSPRPATRGGGWPAAATAYRALVRSLAERP
jgi:glycosyltransferase involved in cell wall biosynthesis